MRTLQQFSRTQIGAKIISQRGPESNGTKGVLHSPQISRTGASTSDGVYRHIPNIPFLSAGFLSLLQRKQHILCLINCGKFLNKSHKFVIAICVIQKSLYWFEK